MYNRLKSIILKKKEKEKDKREERKKGKNH